MGWNQQGTHDMICTEFCGGSSMKYNEPLSLYVSLGDEVRAHGFQN
jgi:hypothetical protein